MDIRPDSHDNQGPTPPPSLSSDLKYQRTSDPKNSAQPCGCDAGAGWQCVLCTKKMRYYEGELETRQNPASVPPAIRDSFTIKDSGARTQTASGMLRDIEDTKVDYSEPLHGPMFDRWAAHLTKAKTKYPDVEPGVPNWTLADDRMALARFRRSAFRHFRQWLRGDTDEDHAAAIFFNVNGAEYVKGKGV